MVDLHSHIIPGVDDGPDDMTASVAMAEVAAHAGTGVIVATPHVREDHPGVRVEEIAGRAAEVDRVLRRHGVGVRVVPGGEVGLGAAISLSEEDLRRATLAGNGRDVLIETPFGALPSVFEELLSGLMDRELRVTLAHPEHNRDLQREPERLRRLVDRGVLVQVTADSLRAPRPSRSRRFAQRVLREGLVHAIASDGHSATWRPPDMRPGLEAARQALPEARAELEWLVDAAPTAILAGEALGPRPSRLPRRGLLRNRP